MSLVLEEEAMVYVLMGPMTLKLLGLMEVLYVDEARRE